MVKQGSIPTQSFGEAGFDQSAGMVQTTDEFKAKTLEFCPSRVLDVTGPLCYLIVLYCMPAVNYWSYTTC